MGHLTTKEKEFYKKNGYLVIKDVLSDKELNEISVEYDKLFARKNQEKMESSWTGSDTNDRKTDSDYTVSLIMLFSKKINISSTFLDLKLKYIPNIKCELN